jgi:hypothetical protein
VTSLNLKLKNYGFLSHSHAVHAHNVAAGIEWIVIIKPGKHTVGNLLNDQFIIGFALFSPPKYAVWMPSHIVNIGFCMPELLFCKRNGKAGFYFLRFHKNC